MLKLMCLYNIYKYLLETPKHNDAREPVRRKDVTDKQNMFLLSLLENALGETLREDTLEKTDLEDTQKTLLTRHCWKTLLGRHCWEETSGKACMYVT